MQNLFFNGINKLFITAVLCVSILSACGGGGGGTPAPLPADQLAYNAALAKYNAAVTVTDYNAAIAEFNTFKNAYPTSTRVDDADFYIARSTHELALIGLASPFPNMPTLVDARLLYDALKNTASNKADDAQYQIGRTYYDVADYPQALIEFGIVLDTNKYSAPSAGDNAQFYIGRTKHQQALLAQIAGSPATTLFNEARAAYNLVISNYTTSNRRDDAQYQIGRTYYDLTLPDYTQAIAEFNMVFANFNPPSAPASVGDDARYYLGRSKHEIALLPAVVPAYTLADARAEYTLVLSNYCAVGVPPSTRCDDARYQVGKTYYDVAVPTALDYSTALGHFQAVISTYGTTASAADNAQYYIGRATHNLALIDLALPSPTGTPTLQQARDAYGLVINNYPTSTRRDDAQYQIGRTYYDVAAPTATDYANALQSFKDVIRLYGTTASAADDAQFYIGRTIHQGTVLGFPSTPTVTYTYANARTEYGVFTSPTTPYPLSIRLDDAAFYSALTFHDANDCPGEKTAMTAFVTNFPVGVSPIFNPLAQQQHLDRMVTGSSGHLIC